MTRKVNWKVLVGILAALVLLGAGGYGLYVWRTERTAAELLSQARQAEKEGRLRDAAGLLANYLAYAPRDNEQRAHMAALLERVGTYESRSQALEVLERVVRVEPDNIAYRRRLIDLAVALERHADASPHLTLLLQGKPDDPELEFLLGRCAEAAREYENATDWYDRSRRHDPGRVESHARLAFLLRRLDLPDRADEVANEMVAATPEATAAYLARARYRREYGTFEGWEEDVTAARKLSPDDPVVLLAAAGLHQARNDLARAREVLRSALERDPKNPALYPALAGVELQAGRPDEAVATLRKGIEEVAEPDLLRAPLAEALVEAGKLTEAGEVISRLREVKYPKAALDYLDGKILMSRGQWKEAARLLESAGKPAGSPRGAPPERAARAEVALGRCYQRLGNGEGAIEAFRRAVVLDPRGLAGRFALASALVAAGRTREALGECRAVASLPHAPRGGVLLLAEALIARNLSLPEGARDWQEVDNLLGRADPAGDSTEVVLLRAKVFEARGRREEARATLEQARDRRPREVAPWLALIALAEREDRPAEALALLDRAVEQCGDSTELQRACIRHWAFRSGPEADMALAEMGKVVESAEESQRPVLLAALAEAYRLRRRYGDAERLWEAYAKLRPADLGARLHLFDLALRDEDQERMARQVEALREIEGEEGTFRLYARATLMMVRARAGDPNALAAARGHLNELSRRRPLWSRTALLSASIAELDGDDARAVEDYQRAISRGDRQVGVARRLIQILTEQQRYPEADAALRRLNREQLEEGDLLRLAAEVSLRLEKTDRALELARREVAADSTDYREQLWLGRLLAAAGRFAEAESPLRRATELAAKEPAPWVTLVECLVRAGKKEPAEAALREATTKLSPEKAWVALARCEEVLGRLDRAEEHIRSALRAGPDDPAVLRGAADYYLRTGQSPKAEAHLRKLMAGPAPAGEQARARRSVALILANAGTYRKFQEALALLAQAGGDSPEDRRARALVLATRPGRRREAIRLLQEVRQQHWLPEEELFLLARLLDGENDWPSAREVLTVLAAAPGNHPLVGTFFTRCLIRHGQLAEAESRIRQAEKESPEAFETVELRARLLKALGKGDEAVSRLRQYVDGKSGALLPAAALLEELGEPAAAEPLYRRHVSNSKRPESRLILAAYLGRQGRFDEALAVLDEAWKTGPADVVAFTAVAMLHAKGVNPAGLPADRSAPAGLPADRSAAAVFDRVERPLAAAAEASANPVPLLVHLATLHELRGRFPEAERVYRRILERDPRNVLALNNLAWLLAHRENGREEALSLIEQAVAAIGPLPELLDTRAVIRLNQGQGAPAVKDLTEVLRDSPSASRYFHMARARLLAGESFAAEEALRKARDLGLKPESLHALERGTYENLLTELAAPSNP